MFFFFFSSRRRHTRWNCDWSSDVCSSDLVLQGRSTDHRHKFVRDRLPADRRFQKLRREDRKSTRLNSSHSSISYAVFCLKKKKPYRLRMCPEKTISINVK